MPALRVPGIPPPFYRRAAPATISLPRRAVADMTARPATGRRESGRPRRRIIAVPERANLRVDVAQPVGIGRRGPQVWFGLNQVF